MKKRNLSKTPATNAILSARPRSEEWGTASPHVALANRTRNLGNESPSHIQTAGGRQTRGSVFDSGFIFQKN